MKTANESRATGPGQMVLLACHGVYDRSTDRFLGEHPEDSVIHAAQLHYAIAHMEWRARFDPLLVISGGRTQATVRRSESRSYVEWAERLGYKLPTGVVLEEFALTSIENLLFSLYRYHQTRGSYPTGVDVISWGFKATRFCETMHALQHWEPVVGPWPKLEYFPVGDLPSAERVLALASEQRYCDALGRGLSAYYAEQGVRELLLARDPWHTRVQARRYYAAYPLPF